MNIPENNIIRPKEFCELEQEVLAEYAKSEKWHALKTYDMVQIGYPYPDHGEMSERSGYGGTNEKNELLPPQGMWCKVEDVLALLEAARQSEAGR